MSHDRGSGLRPGPRRRVIGQVLPAVVAAGALLLAGCGSAATHQPSKSGASGSGASRSGTPGGGAPRQSAAPKSVSTLKYGQIPAWLPKPVAPANQIVTATAGHPALAAVEGDTVDARLTHGSTMVTTVGPAIPQWVTVDAHSGNLNQGTLAPATFTVTLAAPQGTIALNAQAFSILTGEGQIIHPAVTGPHGAPLPARVTAGRPLTLTVKAGLGEGDGALRWAPEGARVLVAWFYQLEFD